MEKRWREEGVERRKRRRKNGEEVEGGGVGRKKSRVKKVSRWGGKVGLGTGRRAGGKRKVKRERRGQRRAPATAGLIKQ